MRNTSKTRCALTFACLLFPLLAHAATPTYSDPVDIARGLGSFITKIDPLVNTAIASTAFLNFVDMIWVAFTVIVIVYALASYAAGETTLFGLLNTAIFIMLVRVLMTTYSLFTDGLWGAFYGIALTLQESMIGTSDPFFSPRFISALWQSITFPSTWSWVDLINALKLGMGLFALSVLATLLSALAYFCVLFGFWGSALAKLIGLAFIPTLLLERTSFLFDGWLRFYLGFCVYAMIAQLNVVMVCVALALYYGFALPPTLGAISTSTVPTMTDISEMLGLFVYFIIGLISLFSTGRFAASIIGGAAGGGLGAAIVSAAMLKTAAARIGSTVTGGRR
jgi:TrbL/VirB6 plasmid conjugal transfer protein